MNILHGLTGSVATTLYPKINDNYNKIGRESGGKIKHLYVCTESSDKITDLRMANAKSDEDEWLQYKINQKVLHIELVKWADVFVIAPCSANTLAKIANGICDNLLTCVARAWDWEKKFIIAPSMNTKMWDHPITKEHLEKVKSWGIQIVNPIEKKLFCGDVGIGAMANIEDIVKEINNG